jgi:hypothetical protein
MIIADGCGIQYEAFHAAVPFTRNTVYGMLLYCRRATAGTYNKCLAIGHAIGQAPGTRDIHNY